MQLPRYLLLGGQVSEIDEKVAKLQTKKEKLLTKKATLVKECEEKDELVTKMMKKRHKLENFISTKISESKSKIFELEKEIEDLRVKLLNTNQNIHIHNDPPVTKQCQW